MRSTFSLLAALSVLGAVDAYWLMGIKNTITVQRMDPIVNPNTISGHAHAIVGGSNFDINLSTDKLLKSECTSIPINEDKSNYWYPQLYFQWANGSFSSVDGGAVIYYLFDDKPGATTAFPPDFRMLSGDPMLRTYDANSFAQRAIEFLCLDFKGTTTKHTSFPEKVCPDGIRSHVNFPSCWDGVNLDSPNHKSHVAFKSGGPDSGTCSDPKFPVTLPRIFLEVYWGSGYFDSVRSQAMNPNQPFVFAHGDPTGYGNHADFFNGWEPGVLQRAVDGCTCDPNGSFDCCVNKGIFTADKDSKCFITPTYDEQTMGTLPKLPGNNPVQPAGTRATMYSDNVIPAMLSPVKVYRDQRNPPAPGNVVTPPQTLGGGAPTSPATTPPPSPTVLPPLPTITSPTSTPTQAGNTSSPSTTPPANTSADGATTTPNNPVTTNDPYYPPVVTTPGTTDQSGGTGPAGTPPSPTTTNQQTGQPGATGSAGTPANPSTTGQPAGPTGAPPPPAPIKTVPNPVKPPGARPTRRPHQHNGGHGGNGGNGGSKSSCKAKKYRRWLETEQHLSHRRRLAVEDHFF